MDAQNFCYWLKGYFEVAEAPDNEGKGKPITSLSTAQVEMIKQHLDYVFKPQVKTPGLLTETLDEMWKRSPASGAIC